MPNVDRFAKALFSLHEIGLLKENSCKGAIKMFIRQATETKHFHLSAHYRSAKAAVLIRANKFRSAAQYQKFCVKNLRHEHVVPGEAIYGILMSEQGLSETRIADILRKFGYRATITRDEDKLLSRDRMPVGFSDPKSPMYKNPLARYIAAGIELEKRDAELWDWQAAD